MHGARNGSKENWLLIKAHDEWARRADDRDILERCVVGRQMRSMESPRRPPTKKAQLAADNGISSRMSRSSAPARPH